MHLSRHRPANPLALHLGRLLQESWQGPAWHGPSLRQAVCAITPELAIVRPTGASHSAWAIVLHASYWKHRVMCRVTGRRHERFPLKPSDWPAPPVPLDRRRWQEDVALLGRCHADLVAALAQFDDRSLGRRCGRWTAAESFRGAALHDVYHAGQIQLLRRQVGRS